jgi:protein subunit release factor A
VCESKLAEVRQQLALCLLPQDKDDDCNAIIEVRRV